MGLQRALSRRTDRHLAALSRQKRRYVASFMPLDQALADEQLGPGVRRWLLAATVAGGTARECLVCGETWLRPAGVLVLDPLGSRQGLGVGLCACCAAPAGLQDRMTAAMERALGFDPRNWQRVATAGLA